jgi:copper chaperone CopZ
MKKILVAATLAALALPSLAFAKETTESMKYAGWHCAGCTSKVEKAVKGVDGVKSAKVTKDTITVVFDDAKTSKDKIKGAIATAGKFEVKDADATKTDAPKTGTKVEPTTPAGT